MDGTGKIENATVEGSTAPAIGFYTWDNSDDAEGVIALDKYEQALNSQYTGVSGTVDYDDETGFAGLNVSGETYTPALVLTGVYNNALSVAQLTALS